MAIQKRTLSKNSPKITINLNEMFGDEFPDSEALKLAVGQAIVDRIRERTRDGISKDGRTFKKYSKSYIDSLPFKSFGKSAGDTNLTLSGDMLGLMDVVDTEGGRITIGWEDDTQAAKAHGHITGAKGNLPVRDFFGLPQTEIEDIKEQLADRVERFKEASDKEGREAANFELLRDALSGAFNSESEDGEG